ncbi:hypothetical protein ABBQ38_008133 [Trebouxia sp. C0009 RCD-2024]
MGAGKAAQQLQPVLGGGVQVQINSPPARAGNWRKAWTSALPEGPQLTAPAAASQGLGCEQIQAVLTAATDSMLLIKWDCDSVRAHLIRTMQSLAAATKVAEEEAEVSKLLRQ